MVLLAAAAPSLSQTPLGTAFTYQGQLKQAGQPFNGPADLLFDLYDADVGGNLLGGHALNGVAISGGLFTVQLNGAGQFGASAFNGEQRWLEISINGTPLLPRQELTAAPNALFSVDADLLDGLDSTAFLQSIPVPLTLSNWSATYIIQTENVSYYDGASGVYGLASHALHTTASAASA
jgi:hypothetical protein